MSQTTGIDDFEGREFNPGIVTRWEYVEGYLFALSLALGEYDAKHPHGADPNWIDYFRDEFAAEIMEKGYQAGINKVIEEALDDDDGEF